MAEAGLNRGCVYLAKPADILPITGSNRVECIHTLGGTLQEAPDRQTCFERYELAEGQPAP